VDNDVGIDNHSSNTIDATNNWWGSNDGPAAVTFAGSGDVTTTTWLVLSISASSSSIGLYGTTTVTANLNYNFDGSSYADVSGDEGSLLDGTPIIFAQTPSGLGTLSDDVVALSSGVADVTFSATGTAGTVTVCAMLDGTILSHDIVIS